MRKQCLKPLFASSAEVLVPEFLPTGVLNIGSFLLPRSDEALRATHARSSRVLSQLRREQIFPIARQTVIQVEAETRMQRNVAVSTCGRPHNLRQLIPYNQSTSSECYRALGGAPIVVKRRTRCR